MKGRNIYSFPIIIFLEKVLWRWFFLCGTWEKGEGKPNARAREQEGGKGDPIRGG